MSDIASTAQTTGCSSSDALAERVVLVCRSPELRVYAQKGLAVADLEVVCVGQLGEARDLLSQDRRFGLVVLELEDPLPRGVEKALARLCEDFSRVDVIGLAPRPSAELVRDAMRSGLRDFLTDPFAADEFASCLRSCVERRQGQLSEPASKVEPDTAPAPSGGSRSREKADSTEPIDSAIVTENAATRRVLRVVDRVAPTDSTVLIEGESGTGKELVARRLHRNSRRAEGPFVEVHCGAIPSNLLESELFGHERGSFTGAVSRQIGLFEVAHGGTIFLDEIAEMNLDMQVKLLRVLQERTFRRIGGKSNVHTDVRVVAATNRDLKSEVEGKRFRADLYYRLNVISLNVPPLRKRLEDIPLLVEFFTDRFHRERDLPKKSFGREAIEELQRMRWVGNVRELENAVERLLLLSSGDVIQPEDLHENLESEGPPVDESAGFATNLTLDEVKSLHIANVLAANGGNKMKSARILGINIKTLYNLIRRLKIPTD